MAIIANNVLVDGLRGKFGRFLVFRNLHGKTVVSAPARKPNKKMESEAQRKTRVTFREATQWARRTLRDPEKKVYYQQRAKALKLPNAYTAAITDYMRKPKVTKVQQGNTITYSVRKPGFAVKDVKTDHTETTDKQPKIVIQRYKDTWMVKYTPGGSITTVPFTFMITDNFGRNIAITP